MARLFSSLKIYLVDLWKRCFVKEYLVKAEGASTAMHDFRKCPECGKHVRSLNVDWGMLRCKCKHVLLKGGKYIDKKERSFKFERPLYSKPVAILKLLLIVDVIVVLCIARVRHVPSMYSGDTALYFSLIFGIAACFSCVVVFNWIEKQFKNEFFELITSFCIVFPVAYLILLAIFPIGGFYIAPFWTKIPTQQEVYEKQISNLEKMPWAMERYEYAVKIVANPRVDVSREFMNAAAGNFARLMHKHHDAILPNSVLEQEFYELYHKYLESLHPDDQKSQCRFDSWNLATARTMKLYPEVWAVCKQIDMQ